MPITDDKKTTSPTPMNGEDETSNAAPVGADSATNPASQEPEKIETPSPANLLPPPGAVTNANKNPHPVDLLSDSDSEEKEVDLDLEPVDQTGLTSEQVIKRREEFGRNEIVEEAEPAWKAFLKYFMGPIPYMIEAACILAAVLQDWVDMGIILVLLIANAILGYNEEKQAGDAVAALKKVLNSTSRVRRDGTWIDVAVGDLVPGDIVLLRGGDAVPADGIVAHAANVQMTVDQSALTGESLPVNKRMRDPLLSGSIVRSGEGTLLVQRTGVHTFMGEAAHLVATAKPSGNFQKTVMKIGDFLLLLDIIISIVIIIFGIIHHEPVADVIQFCLVLAIASIPVAMPMVLSVTMAVGSRELASRRVIVTRLTAIEELASVNVLCSDKTGTLTKNEITVRSSIPLRSMFSERIVRTYAALASNWNGREVIDQAVMSGLDKNQLEDDYEQLEFIPFDPITKRAQCKVHDKNTGQDFYVTKGAPQMILALLEKDVQEIAKPRYDRKVSQLASSGLRCLSVAMKKEGEPWGLVGFLTLLDPPREDSAETLQRLLELGIRSKMITGDQTVVGVETAKLLGMGTQSMSGDQFRGGSHIEMRNKVVSCDVFGEMKPAEKYLVVEILQEQGYLVAMTGDGVNDAPALKKANVGFAVSGATDAARNAASVVLLEPGLSVIAQAVVCARQIFSRMLAYVTYRVATTVHMLFFMTVAILGYSFFIPPVLIVLITLMNDVSIISIAYDKAPVNTEGPSNWRLPKLLTLSTIIGICMTCATFFLYYYGLTHDYTNDELETIVYLNISISGHLVVFTTRVQDGSFVARRLTMFFSSAILGTQLIASVFAAEGVLMHAVGWETVGYVWVYSLLWFLVIDAIKQITENIFSSDRHVIAPSPFLLRIPNQLDERRMSVPATPSFISIVKSPPPNMEALTIED